MLVPRFWSSCPLPCDHHVVAGREPGVLVELGVVEQRYRAVLEVLDEGVPVTVVARRYGVARQTVHQWLRRYASKGGPGSWSGRAWCRCRAVRRCTGRWCVMVWSMGRSRVSRWVNAHGKISLAGFSYAAGATYAGEPVGQVLCSGHRDRISDFAASLI